jgi:pimeloyl-[acyl-carrier protein] methyl ester esterase
MVTILYCYGIIGIPKDILMIINKSGKIWLHGFATTPEIWSAGGPPLNFDDLDREADKVAKSVSQGDILIGWSMGGMVAIKAAVLAQEKLKALVLVSTTPKFLRSSDFAAGLPPVLIKRLEKKIETEGTKAFHDLIFKNGHAIGLAHLPIEQAERELAELTRVDLRSELQKIKSPTLIIHGDCDEICLPAAAKYMHEKIAGSELVMLKGVGHAPMVEAPELFNSIINKYAGQRAN